MPNLTHSEEQEQKRTADAVMEKSAGRANRQQTQERNPLMQVAKEIDLQRRRDTMLMGARLDVDELKREVTSAIEEMKRSVTNEKDRTRDSFRPGGPDGAAQTVRDALEQSRANQRLAQLEKIAQSLNDMVRSVEHARESISARLRDTTVDFRRELDAELAKAPGEKVDGQERLELDAGERRVALAQRQVDEVDRLQQFFAEAHQASLSFARDIQSSLARDSTRSNEPWLQQLQDRLRKFDEQCDLIVAMRNVWDGRFSDVEALRRTWERAAAGKSNDKNGFDEARESFWKSINEARAAAERNQDHDQRRLTEQEVDARQVVKLLDKVGVQWQEGTNAPLLGRANAKIEELRQAAKDGDQKAGEVVKRFDDSVRITIDHVADKKAHPALTLDASNLRFLDNRDNSARGNLQDVAEGRKVDFVRSEEHQAENAARRDQAASQRLNKVYDRLEDAAIELAEKLKLAQLRTSTDHQRDLNAAQEAGADKLAQLRGPNLRFMDGENEAQRRERREQLVQAYEHFHREQEQQIKSLQAFETRLHATQKLELSQAQANASDASASTKVFMRSAEDRERFEQLWSAMDEKRHQGAAQMLVALQAATREAREEAIKRAYEQQQQTKQAQEALLAKFEQERRGRMA